MESMWAFLEVMGHRSHYGRISEEEAFGTKLVRVDIFRTGGEQPEATHFYGASSIFSLTPVDEEKCRKKTDQWMPVALLPSPDIDEDDDWEERDPYDRKAG